jgi:hypothetical protein
MFRARLVLLALIAYSASTLAKDQSYAGWQIYPGAKGSPTIELPTGQGPWRLLHHDGSLIVEIPQPSLKRGYIFNFGECRIDGVLRQDLIASVRHVATVEWSEDVSEIWIADPKEKRFVRRGGNGVRCRNEGYGV